MPLPPAPTKRAALLSATAIETSARPAAKTASKTGSYPRSQKPQAFDATNDHSTTSGSHDAAPYKDKEAAKPVKIGASSYKNMSVESPDGASFAKAVKKPKHSGPTKLFVLDTNVLMHDPMCLFRFEEHDIFLPMIVLEELDGHKKGMTEVARNARQTSIFSLP